jgi:hypothetical protein
MRRAAATSLSPAWVMPFGRVLSFYEVSLETHLPPDQATLMTIGIGFVAFGILVAALMARSVLKERALAVDGVVVSSSTECQQPNNNRCVSTYVLRSPKNENVIHKAGYGGSSLPLNLTVGTKIIKRRGEFSYQLGERTVDDSPGLLAFLFFGIPLVFIAVGVWLLLWRGLAQR